MVKTRLGFDIDNCGCPCFNRRKTVATVVSAYKNGPIRRPSPFVIEIDGTRIVAFIADSGSEARELTREACVVEADGSSVWEGKAESEPVPLVKVLSPWRDKIAPVGIEACPLSEWLHGALVQSGFQMVCIETRHAQRFLSSRPNKTDRSDNPLLI